MLCIAPFFVYFPVLLFFFQCFLKALCNIKGRLINVLWVTFLPLSEQVQILPLFASHTAFPPSSVSSQTFLSKVLLPAAVMQLFFHCFGIKNILSLWLDCINLLEFVSTPKTHSIFCTLFPLYYLTCHHCSFRMLVFAKTVPKMLVYLLLISFLV